MRCWISRFGAVCEEIESVPGFGAVPSSRFCFSVSATERECCCCLGGDRSVSWEEEGEEEESIGYLFVIFVVNLDNLTEIHLIDVVELSLLNARIHVVELSVAHR